MTGIPLLAQTEGPTRWPRGIRKLAKPDLLVSFTCLTRAPATPVPFSRSSSFILLWVGIERRCIARRAMRSTGSRLTCIHTYLRTRTYTCFSFGPCSLDRRISLCMYVNVCVCAKDKPLSSRWELDTDATLNVRRVTIHKKKLHYFSSKNEIWNVYRIYLIELRAKQKSKLHCIFRDSNFIFCLSSFTFHSHYENTEDKRRDKSRFKSFWVFADNYY